MTDNINNSKKDINNGSFLVGRRREELLAELQRLQERFTLSPRELQQLLSEDTQEGIGVPLSVFQQSSLGILEAMVCYLIDWLHMTPAVIAQALNRSQHTIRNAYQQSRVKLPGGVLGDDSLRIPLEIFSNREKAPLFSIIEHLHDAQQWRFADIARALVRDPRNINSIYRRYKK